MAERRKQMQFCEGHLNLMTALARIEERQIAMDLRINGTIDDIKQHIGNSRPRNIAICVALVTVFIFIYNQAVNLGENRRQIEVNTKRWDRLLEKNPIVVQPTFINAK